MNRWQRWVAYSVAAALGVAVGIGIAHAARANGSYAAAGVFRVSADGRTPTTDIRSVDRFDVRHDAHAVRIGEFDPPGLHWIFAGSCGSRTVTVTLERPLGDRSLVNLGTGTKAGGPDLLRMTAPPAGYAHDYDTVLFATDDPAYGIKSETLAYEQHLTGPDGETITIVQSPEPLLDDPVRGRVGRRSRRLRIRHRPRDRVPDRVHRDRPDVWTRPRLRAVRPGRERPGHRLTRRPAAPAESSIETEQHRRDEPGQLRVATVQAAALQDRRIRPDVHAETSPAHRSPDLPGRQPPWRASNGSTR